MGRTVPTRTMELANLLAVWERELGRALYRPKDRGAFRQMTLEANRYCPCVKQMASGDRVERALLSIILGQQRRILELERRGGWRRIPRGTNPALAWSCHPTSRL